MSSLFKNKKSYMVEVPTNYKESVDYYTNNLQHKIDATWEYASDNFEVGEEKVFGTQEYTSMVCRVTKAISPKTGKNLGDDFKKLIFTDLQYDVHMGARYTFMDNVWIVNNTDDYKYTSKSAIVRRCNNVMRWRDEYGNIYNEPCILGYELQYDNVYYNNVLEIPQGTTIMRCQNNEFSRMLKKNDRLIFGSEVYKIHSRLDSLRSNTFDKNSVPVIDFGIYIDIVSPYDDFENQLAYNNFIDKVDTIDKEYEIKFTPLTDYLISGEEQIFTFNLYEDKNITNYTFTFVDTMNISSDYYKFEVIDGNRFKLTNIKQYTGDSLLINISCNEVDFSQEFRIRMRGLY